MAPKYLTPNLQMLLACLDIFLTFHGTSVFSTSEFVMRRQKFFENHTPAMRDQHFARIYTYVTNSFYLSPLVIGFLYDKFGLCRVRLMVQCLVLVGLGLIIQAHLKPEFNHWVQYGHPLLLGLSMHSMIYFYKVLSFYKAEVNTTLWLSLMTLFMYAGQQIYLILRHIKNCHYFWYLIIFNNLIVMTRTYFMVGDLDVEQVRKSVLRAVVDQSSDHEKDTVQLVKREEVSETDSNASVPEIMKDNFITQMKNLFHPTFHVCRM